MSHESSAEPTAPEPQGGKTANAKRRKKDKREVWHRKLAAYVAYICYRAVETLTRLLPLPLVFTLGGMLGWVVAWLLPGYRKMAERGLFIAFGREKSSAEIRKMARQHLSRLGANWLCAMKMPYLPTEAVKDRLEWVGRENATAVTESGRGLIYALMHMGNWELLAQLDGLGEGNKPATMYQPLGNPYLNAHVAKLRARIGVKLFSRNDGFFGPANWLKERGAIGILVDQHAGDGGVWCPFFGKLASTTNLTHLLAHRGQAAILPLGIATIGRARWRVTVHPPLAAIRNSDAATAELNVLLEQVIRESPLDWFWVHNRWKIPKPNFLLEKYKRGVTLPKHCSMDDLQPFEMLIRSPNWLGDACMAVPAVRALKKGRPDARITILAPEKLAEIWKLVPEVSEVVCIPHKASLLATRKLVKSTGVRYEVAILFPNSLRSALEVWKNGIPRIVGYAGHSRKKLLQQIIPEPEEPGPRKHHTRHYLRIAMRLGAQIERSQIWAPIPRPEGLPLLANRFGLCPGAEYGPAKRYPAERFAEAANIVQQQWPGSGWVIFGAKGDVDVAGVVERGIQGEVTNLAGKTSLSELIQELRKCRLLLTNDTGTMHLAVLLGVPTVSIFGSTEPAWTGPLGTEHTVLRRHVECSPCFLRECPIDFRCMKEIEPIHVAAAVLADLEQPR
jgi:heptosyltransferase II